MALFASKRRNRRHATPITEVDLRDDAVIHVLAVSGDAWLPALLDRCARQGIRSERVTDCDTALARTGTRDYDVVVVTGTTSQDLVRLCRCLREGGVRSSILAIAEDSTVHDVVAALDGGADGLLAGPVDDTEFIARVQAARRRHEYNREPRWRPDILPGRDLAAGPAPHQAKPPASNAR